MNRFKKQLEERSKRFDLVFGILLASILGFALNVLSSLYYDLFIVETIKWVDINKYQLAGVIGSVVFVIGFLNFLIHDYKNEIELNKSFIKRFFAYFFYGYFPGKIIRIFLGIYLVLFSIALIIIIYLIIAKIMNYYWASLFMVVVGVFMYFEQKNKK